MIENVQPALSAVLSAILTQLKTDPDPKILQSLTPILQISVCLQCSGEARFVVIWKEKKQMFLFR